MSRVKEWPIKLADFHQQKKNQPFVWGENDCCLFTCEWIGIVTGKYPDIATTLKGTYNDALSAARVLEEHGGLDRIVEDYALSQNWQEIPPAYAQRGDIAIVENEHGRALGVVFGRFVLMAGQDGIGYIETTLAKRAWRVI